MNETCVCQPRSGEGLHYHDPELGCQVPRVPPGPECEHGFSNFGMSCPFCGES